MSEKQGELTPELLCMHLVLDALHMSKHSWAFAAPFNPVSLGWDDYFDVIKKPMDLGTIRNKLHRGCYLSYDHFISDVNLIFDNAIKYNKEGANRTNVHELAREMKTFLFEIDPKRLPTSILSTAKSSLPTAAWASKA